MISRPVTSLHPSIIKGASIYFTAVIVRRSNKSDKNKRFHLFYGQFILWEAKEPFIIILLVIHDRRDCRET